MSEQALDINTWLKIKVGKDLKVLSTQQVIYTEHLLHLVLVHSISSTQFRSRIARMLDDDQKSIQKDLCNLFPILKEDPTLNSQYKIAFMDYMFGKEKTLKSLGLKPKPIDRMIALYPITKAPDIKIEDYSIKKMDRLFAKLTPDINRYIKTFVSYKLRFIADSNRLSLSDLEGDLYIHGLINYRWLYPFRTPEHMLGSLKQSVHNAGINMLYTYTSQKRNRMSFSNAEGFSNTHVDIITLEGKNNDWETSAVTLGNNSLTESLDSQELKIGLSQLKDRLSPKQKKVLDMFMTENPPEDLFNLAEELFNVRVIGDDYQDFVKRLRSREDKQGLEPYSLLVRLIGEYTHTSPSKVKSLLNQVRLSLAL